MSEELKIFKKNFIQSFLPRNKGDGYFTKFFVKRHINNLSENELKELENFLELDDETILNFYNFNKKNKKIEKNLISQIFKNFKIK